MWLLSVVSCVFLYAWMSVSRGRSLSRSTGDRNFSPNGRKRKLSSQNSTGQASKSQTNSSRANSKKEKQSVLDFSPSTKRIRISQSFDTTNSDQPGPSGVSTYIPRIVHSSSDSEEDDVVYLNGDMAQQNTTGYNQTIGTNNFKAHKAAGTVGLNNHAKKSGGGKKLVIKNRKGELSCLSSVHTDSISPFPSLLL